MTRLIPVLLGFALLIFSVQTVSGASHPATTSNSELTKSRETAFIGILSVDWKITLDSFQNSKAFSKALETFIDFYKERSSLFDTDQLDRAKKLKDFLDSEDVTYDSIQGLTQIISDLAALDSQRDRLIAHLLWVDLLFTELVHFNLHNPTYLKIHNEMQALIELSSPVSSKEALVARVDELLKGRLLEVQNISKTLSVERSHPEYADRLLSAYHNGDLTAILRRLLLGKFCRPQSLFKPMPQMEAFSVLQKAPNGGYSRIEKVTDFNAPETFVLDGVSLTQETDVYSLMVHGLLQRRQAFRHEPIPREIVKSNKVIVLLMDVSPSMSNSDGRWELRDAIATSYLDSAFSHARINSDLLTARVFTYEESLMQEFAFSNWNDFSEHWLDFNEIRSKGDSTNHTRAIIESLTKIASTNSEALTHLNFVIITDGESENEKGALDLDSIQEKIKSFDNTSDKTSGKIFNSSFEKTQISFSTITLVEGDKTFSKLAEDLSAKDNLSHVHFDKQEVLNWLSSKWILQNVNSSLKRRSYSLNTNMAAVMNLIRALREFQTVTKTPVAAPEVSSTTERSSVTSDEAARNPKEKPESNSADKAAKPQTQRQEEGNGEGESKNEGDAKAQTQSQSQNKPNSKKRPLEQSLTDSHAPLNVDAESMDSAKAIVLEIKSLSGPRPSMIFVPHTHNIERSQLTPLTLSNRANPQLVLESQIPIVVKNGLAPLYSADEYQLSGVKIHTESGQSIENEDFQIFESKHNGLYVAQFHSDKVPDGTRLKITFSYHTRPFGRENNFYFSSHFATPFSSPFPLNKIAFNQKSVLTQIADEMDLAGARELAGAIGGLTTRRRVTFSHSTFSARDIEALWASSGFYTFLPPLTEPATTSTPDKPFFEFSHFLRDGVYYFQCSGANNLLTAFFSRFFSLMGLPYRAEIIDGYVVPPVGRWILQNAAHRITSLSENFGSKRYVRLDGTPQKMDKDSPKPRSLFTIPRLKKLTSFLGKVKNAVGRAYQQTVGSAQEKLAETLNGSRIDKIRSKNKPIEPREEPQENSSSCKRIF